MNDACKKRYEELIVDIPNHPKPGVTYKDITPVFSDPDAFREVVDELAAHFEGRGITKVMGAEARGFILGAPLACRMGVGFVPARKPGKLPRKTVAQSYELEYGTDTLEVHADALGLEDRVLVVDDLLATGGTAAAMVSLTQACGARVSGLGFFVELGFLHPRELLARVTDAEVFSLVNVEG